MAVKLSLLYGLSFQEVLMLKNSTKEYMNVWYKQASLVHYVLFILIALISLTLTYVFVVPDEPAHANYSSLDYRRAEVTKTAKQAILQWMKENSAMSEQVLAKIYNAASNTGNRDLILAICLVESNFNPHAESGKGAIGLMGIMPGVWVDELKTQGIIQEREDLYKVSGNIAAGAYVIATYLAETNDLRQALIRYVGGASSYATRVLRAQEKIKLAQLSLTVVQD